MKIFITLFSLSSCLYLNASAQGEKALLRGEHFADVNNLKIHYYVRGKGPLCLVPSPGWGISVDYLKNTLTEFEKYFTLIFFDTRHSGKSTGPEDPTKYSCEDFMNDLDALRIYFNQSRIWIMGHSAGGHMVLHYGIHHSNKLHGIIALDAVAAADSIWEAEMSKMIEKRKNESYYEKSINTLMGTDTTKRKEGESFNLILPYYFHDAKKVEAFTKIASVQIDRTVGKYVSKNTYWQKPLLPDLHKISVPVLVIVGDDDFICDKTSQADRIVANLRYGTEVVIKDAGHFCWYEQPNQFNAELKKWLTKQKIIENK